MGVLGWTAWHQASRDGKFHWRRWRKGDWEIREMTSDEQDDALRGIQLTIRCPPYAHIDPRQGSARATKVPHRELKPLAIKEKAPDPKRVESRAFHLSVRLHRRRHLRLDRRRFSSSNTSEFCRCAPRALDPSPISDLWAVIASASRLHRGGGRFLGSLAGSGLVYVNFATNSAYSENGKFTSALTCLVRKQQDANGENRSRSVRIGKLTVITFLDPVFGFAECR